jgi:hypothetical protein
LHVKDSQLRHCVEFAEQIFDSFFGKSVAVTIDLFRSADEV